MSTTTPFEGKPILICLPRAGALRRKRGGRGRSALAQPALQVHQETSAGQSTWAAHADIHAT
eukprot:5419479-Pyramimonas_sp.AAC.1